MKILHTVEFYEPSTGGAQEVVRQLSEHLAAQGHEVTVATTKLPERKTAVINGVRIAEFDLGGNSVNGIRDPGGEAERYQKFLIEGGFDVIMNYAAQQWTADLAFGVLDRLRAKKVLVPCGFSGLHDPKYRDYFAQMPEILKGYDATVFLSDTYQDRQFAREQGVTNAVLIPNGADEREFGRLDKSAGAGFRRRHGIRRMLILTIGNHTGEKGHRKSMLAFLLAPVPGATLAVVGRSFHAGNCLARCTKLAGAINWLAPLTGKRVLLLDLDRPQVLEALAAADIFLFLSNIECSPLVLFEAAAVGLPFIASDAGNSREITEWTRAGWIVDCYPGELGRVRPKLRSAVKLLTRLARRPEQRRQMGQAGRAAWERQFTWAKIAQQYLELYKDLVHE